MAQSAKAAEILAKIHENTPMGELKKLAKPIKRDHELALELWATKKDHARMFAALIFDTKLLTQEFIESLADDLMKPDVKKANYISEWLLANQLMKSKKLTALIETWEHHPSVVLQRLFWYHQARLRWTGKGDPGTSEHLLKAAKTGLASAHADVQWAMNFCLAWIGTYEPHHRETCVQLGEQVGLYRDEKVPRNCTPNYLPEFIRIEVEKLDARS